MTEILYYDIEVNALNLENINRPLICRIKSHGWRPHINATLGCKPSRAILDFHIVTILYCVSLRSVKCIQRV